MYDHVVIKGLSPIRKSNGSEDDYNIYNDIENMGLISYIPKYISNPDNFTDPARNKAIHSEAHKVVYRAYVTYRTQVHSCQIYKFNILLLFRFFLSKILN